MAKFRMVPDNLNEGKFVLARIDEYVNANLKKFAEEGAAGVPKIREMLKIQENWVGVVKDLAEGDDEKPAAPAKVAPPAAKKEAPAKAGDAIAK